MVRSTSPPGALFGGAIAAVGLGLLVLRLLQRSVAIAIGAVLFGTIGVLQSLSIISNTLGQLTGTSASNGAVISALGLLILMLGTGLRLRERANA